ncbi:beta-ketoacyl-ACP synthase II [Ligilactobacillus hohenheimensis]|uniref:beta-ketoacyl-ACP synthase II n=1 Tax=Ligilactobacillus hohenheimensis TaxID=2991832 RepID=UPI0024B8D213|nr:beta-ketoacyl-ACP synthase II [Ligilactobacillus hohenheimensis]
MARVVVTGMGVVAPNGITRDEFIENTFAGKVGIKPITKFDATDTGISVAGQVDGFDYKERVGREGRRMDLFAQYSVHTALEAVEQAGITPENTRGEDMGVIFGTGIGGLSTIQKQILKMGKRGPRAVSPLFVPEIIPNMGAGNIAIRLGAKNTCMTIVTACSTATNSIGEAFRQIKEGRAEVMITGGAEAPIDTIGIAGFASLTALSKESDPLKASTPFDENRSGFVLGEGAAALVLESYDHAKARGAKILAEVVGYGSTCDAYHITAPDPTGDGAARALKQAMDEAGITPDQVGYLNAHGTATHANDVGEAKAINLAFGTDSDLQVSSTKSMTGHLLGAAGAVEAVATVAALQRGELPPNMGLTKQDPECQINVVTEPGTKAPDLEYAMSDSLGFGGHDAVLAFKKWSD